MVFVQLCLLTCKYISLYQPPQTCNITDMRAWAAATGHWWTVNVESSWAYVPLVCKSENGRHLRQLEESGEGCFEGCLEGEARVMQLPGINLSLAWTC